MLLSVGGVRTVVQFVFAARSVWLVGWKALCLQRWLVVVGGAHIIYILYAKVGV